MVDIASPELNPLSRQHDLGRMHLRTFLVALRYEMGEHADDIATQYGISRTTVHRVAKLFGCKPRPTVDAVRKAAILREYQEGVPVKVIADTHECSQALVSKYATLAGIGRYNIQKDAK